MSESDEDDSFSLRPLGGSLQFKRTNQNQNQNQTPSTSIRPSKESTNVNKSNDRSDASSRTNAATSSSSPPATSSAASSTLRFTHVRPSSSATAASASSSSSSGVSSSPLNRADLDEALDSSSESITPGRVMTPQQKATSTSTSTSSKQPQPHHRKLSSQPGAGRLSSIEDEDEDDSIEDPFAVTPQKPIHAPSKPSPRHAATSSALKSASAAPVPAPAPSASSSLSSSATRYSYLDDSRLGQPIRTRPFPTSSDSEAEVLEAADRQTPLQKALKPLNGSRLWQERAEKESGKVATATNEQKKRKEEDDEEEKEQTGNMNAVQSTPVSSKQSGPSSSPTTDHSTPFAVVHSDEHVEKQQPQQHRHSPIHPASPLLQSNPQPESRPPAPVRPAAASSSSSPPPPPPRSDRTLEYEQLAQAWQAQQAQMQQQAAKERSNRADDQQRRPNASVVPHSSQQQPLALQPVPLSQPSQHDPRRRHLQSPSPSPSSPLTSVTQLHDSLFPSPLSGVIPPSAGVRLYTLADELDLSEAIADNKRLRQRLRMAQQAIEALAVQEDQAGATNKQVSTVGHMMKAAGATTAIAAARGSTNHAVTRSSTNPRGRSSSSPYTTAFHPPSSLTLSQFAHLTPARALLKLLACLEREEEHFHKERSKWRGDREQLSNQLRQLQSELRQVEQLVEFAKLAEQGARAREAAQEAAMEAFRVERDQERATFLAREKTLKEAALAERVRFNRDLASMEKDDGYYRRKYEEVLVILRRYEKERRQQGSNDGGSGSSSKSSPNDDSLSSPSHPLQVQLADLQVRYTRDKSRWMECLNDAERRLVDLQDAHRLAEQIRQRALEEARRELGRERNRRLDAEQQVALMHRALEKKVAEKMDHVREIARNQQQHPPQPVMEKFESDSQSSSDLERGREQLQDRQRKIAELAGMRIAQERTMMQGRIQPIQLQAPAQAHSQPRPRSRSRSRSRSRRKHRRHSRSPQSASDSDDSSSSYSSSSSAHASPSSSRSPTPHRSSRHSRSRSHGRGRSHSRHRSCSRSRRHSRTRSCSRSHSHSHSHSRPRSQRGRSRQKKVHNPPDPSQPIYAAAPVSSDIPTSYDRPTCASYHASVQGKDAHQHILPPNQRSCSRSRIQHAQNCPCPAHWPVTGSNAAAAPASVPVTARDRALRDEVDRHVRRLEQEHQQHQGVYDAAAAIVQQVVEESLTPSISPDVHPLQQPHSRRSRSAISNCPPVPHARVGPAVNGHSGVTIRVVKSGNGSVQQPVTARVRPANHVSAATRAAAAKKAAREAYAAAYADDAQFDQDGRMINGRY